MILYPAETKATEQGIEITLRHSDGREVRRLIPAPFTHEQIVATVDEMAQELGTGTP
jgi:hypothetical protein